MPTFQISFMRVDRDEDPTVVESFHRTVDWSLLPREGEGIDLGNDCPVTVESVGYDFDGYANVFMGRIVLDDLQAAQLRKLGWRVEPLPFGWR
jgi:hypothetical protein